MDWLRRLWLRLPGRRREAGSVVAGPAELCLARDGAVARRLPWDRVTRIEAFKLDCYVVDCICLRFHVRGETPLTVDESMAGFETLAGVLERRLGISPEWYLTVMFPAFETNLAIIWEAPARPDLRDACSDPN